MLINEGFKDYVLRNIDIRLRQKLFYAYNNGLNINRDNKEVMDVELLDNLKSWFKKNGVIEYV